MVDRQIGRPFATASPFAIDAPIMSELASPVPGGRESIDLRQARPLSQSQVEQPGRVDEIFLDATSGTTPPYASRSRCDATSLRQQLRFAQQRRYRFVTRRFDGENGHDRNPA